MLENFPYVEILSLISMFILNYLKYRRDIIVADKKNTKQHEKLFESINKISSVINEEHNLFDSISIAGITIIQSNVQLDSRIIRLVNATIKEVREFAIKYNKSHFRKNKKDIEDYLRIESETIMSNLDVLADDIFNNKQISGVSMVYSKFSKEFSDIEIIVRSLIRDLIKNGLTRKEYNDLFVSFIQELVFEQIKLWNRWRRDYK